MSGSVGVTVSTPLVRSTEDDLPIQDISNALITAVLKVNVICYGK